MLHRFTWTAWATGAEGILQLDGSILDERGIAQGYERQISSSASRR
jgi:hypothetical protein